MAVEFTRTANQEIDFGVLSGVGAPSQMTVCAWLYPHVLDNTTQRWIVKGSDADGGFEAGVAASAVGSGIRWMYVASGTNGVWTSDTALTANTWQHAAVTFDNGNINNTPLMYVNGSSSAITERVTPDGAFEDDGTASVLIGNLPAGDRTFDGYLADLRIYTRILSAAEIAEIGASYGADGVRESLAFQCLLSGAGGNQTYEGATLGATDYIYDHISGAAGTPTTSPKGFGDNYISHGR